jgi:hypothetical protein
MALIDKAHTGLELTPAAVCLRTVACGAFEARAALSDMVEAANG